MTFRKTACSTVAMLAITAICSADEKPRLGVSVIETSNTAGVIVTKVEHGSPATSLDRVGEGHDLKLAPRKHAITHVNGRQVRTPDRFVEAIAASPRDCVLRVYEYASEDWSDHRVKLQGEPTVKTHETTRTTQYWMDGNGNVSSQDGQYQYTQQGYAQQRQHRRQYAQNDDRGRRRSRKRFLNMWGLPEGDDWRPGDHVWLFQKKPENPELRKAHRRQMFAEILTGVAAGMSGAAAGMDSYQPQTPAGGSGFNSNSGYRQMQRDSFNRGYSTNPDHAPWINWAD